MADARKLVLGVILVAVAAASWWFTREAAQPIGITSPKARHDPDYIAENFTAPEMDEQGTPKYVLTAERLTHDPDDDTAHYVKPVLVQYQPNEVRVTTRGDEGVMPGDGKEIIMTGNVHMTRTGTTAAAPGEITSERLRVELDR